MKIKIRLAKIGDLKKYTELFQETYQEVYTNESLGLGKDLFSKRIFNSPDTQKYLAGNLKISDKQQTWLAFVSSNLVGSITIEDKGKEFELKGFYIKPKFQGKGIGKKLWILALKFANGKNVVLDIYAHNTNTIEIYKRWGFIIDKEKGEFYRHWPEWPEEVRAKSIYMRYNQ